MCELMPRMARLITSMDRSGYRCCNIRSRTRLKEKEGSGVPNAADSPRTNIRMASCFLSWSKRNGCGFKWLCGDRNCQTKRSFSITVPEFGSLRKKRSGITVTHPPQDSLKNQSEEHAGKDGRGTAEKHPTPNLHLTEPISFIAVRR